MFWIWIIFACSCCLHLNSKEKNAGQRRLFIISCGLLILNMTLYGVEWFYANRPCFHLSLVLFFLLGFGLIQLVKMNPWHRYWHSIPFVLFVVLYVLHNEVPTNVIALSTLNQEGVLGISALAFVYANYGYWCLIKRKFYQTLQQYTSFYVALLYGIAILFLVIYFYPYELFNYIRIAFLVASGSLLVGTLFYEMSLLLSGRIKRQTVSRIGELDVLNQRLFGTIALQVSQASVKGADGGSMMGFNQIAVTNLSEEPAHSIESTTNPTAAIRERLSSRLIDTRLFLNPTLNLDQVVDLVQIPKNDLIRFFKASQAVTFKQYINRLKVEYAVLLIREREESYTVEELSLLCGFNTRLSFYRAFVEVYGFAPSEILA